jgi:hypothetical protein
VVDISDIRVDVSGVRVDESVGSSVGGVDISGVETGFPSVSI